METFALTVKAIIIYGTGSFALTVLIAVVAMMVYQLISRNIGGLRVTTHSEVVLQ